MSGKYLKHIKMDAFGAFSNRLVGPFSPGLNVVFGPNEAGKTTLSQFVGGVLFGWEEARGLRNTYKPANAERAGTLLFADDETGESAQVTRVRNADGLQGDVSVVSDIDRETYKTMFSLSSDELRRLKNTSDVAAKLLTAGSGTGASPAHALAELQQRLATFTSRAQAAENSLVNLEREQDKVRTAIAQETAQVEKLKNENREFAELAPQREELLAKIAELNAAVETLAANRKTLEKIESETADLQQKIADLRAQEEDLRREHRALQKEHPQELAGISATEERHLRDRLEALSVETAKMEHAVDLARDNYATSRASYEALLEADDEQELAASARRQRNVQIVLSIALPVAFMAAGIPLFMHGRDITSLSFTALGFCLVLVAVIMAAASLVMLFRPNKKAEAADARVQDARWVMLQDKKKLEACRAEQEEHRTHVEDELASVGLSEAKGSLRHARALLDEARDARSENALYLQRKQALVSRRTALEESLSSAVATRDELYAEMGFRPERGTLEAVDAFIARKTRQREGLMENSEHMNRRYGELSQILDQGAGERTFDELKLRYEELQTRRDESAMEFAKLLLARRMLETAIAAWESKSQPEVYARASELLASMTDGAWTTVSMSEEGRLQVGNDLLITREPVHLSLGTCQQLYLALRIALLITADNVGRSIPIIADDILVNFDSKRRVAAARALAQLACHRQVVVLTCHEEIVETMRLADSSLNEVVL